MVKTIKVNKKTHFISNKDTNDILVLMNDIVDTCVSLKDPSLLNPWVLSINKAIGNICLKILDNQDQNLIIYLNGSSNLFFTIKTPPKLNKFNIIIVSENTIENEEITIDFDLANNNNVDISFLLNNFNTTKLITTKINHNGTYIYSNVKLLGINKKGTLKSKVNTVFKYDYGGCRQKLRIINLANDVKSECDPILTILNNNIDYASHGATIGSFDRDHLFYLQTKGLDENESKKLLVESSIFALVKILNNKKIENFITSQFMFKVFMNND